MRSRTLNVLRFNVPATGANDAAKRVGLGQMKYIQSLLSTVACTVYLGDNANYITLPANTQFLLEGSLPVSSVVALGATPGTLFITAQTG